MEYCKLKEQEHQNENGGKVYQDVVRSPKLTSGAKGLYAYLASFCGESNECCPSVEMICKETNVTKTTMYKYMKELVEHGVVEKKQTYAGNLRSKVVYKLTHEVRA